MVKENTNVTYLPKVPLYKLKATLSNGQLVVWTQQVGFPS